MKRILFISIFLFLFHAIDAEAANWYVQGSGSGSGTSWTAAWNRLSAINWSTVSCGDTIWVAGGTYGDMSPTTKTCTSGAPLSIRRARSDASACTGAAGWSGSYDSTVIQDNGVIQLNPGTYNYITISGRTTASGGNYGWHIYNHTTSGDVYGIIMWNESIFNNLTVEYMDIEGPNRKFDDGTWGSTGIRDSSYTAGYSSNITYSHLKIHGVATGMFVVAGDNYLIEYIDMYDIDNHGGNNHPNLIYITGSNNGVIRYSNFHNSAAYGTGIGLVGPGTINGWSIYGNKFYDMTGCAMSISTGGPFGGNGAFTGLKLYNNTFSNNQCTINFYSGSSCASGCETKNNIFHGTGGSISLGATSNNLVTSNSSIFTNYSARDFHIISSTGSSYPRNAGTSLSSYFTADMDGTTFGGDGTWDIGAYNYATGGGSITKSSNIVPTNLHIIN